MKKIVAILIALTMLFAMTGALAEEYKIGAIVFQEDMFMQMWTAGCQAAAAEYGWTINCANDKDDPAELANLIQTYIDQDYDAIVLQYTDAETALNYCRRAHDAGIVVGSSSIVSDEELEVYALAMCTEQAALGHGSGDAAVKYIQENGIEDVKIGIVQFVSQGAWYSQQRSGNFLDSLDQAGIKYEVVADQDAWMQDTALTTCTDMLTAHPEINIIYGANDGATIGSTMAVKNLGLTKQVAVFGCDASEQICNLLLDNDNYSLVGTAAQDAYGMGYKTAIAAMDAVLGNENELLGKFNPAGALPLNDYDVDAVNQYVEDISAFN